jgi:membrane-bound lytic murein transglycosylase B
MRDPHLGASGPRSRSIEWDTSVPASVGDGIAARVETKQAGCMESEQPTASSHQPAASGDAAWLDLWRQLSRSVGGTPSAEDAASHALLVLLNRKPAGCPVADRSLAKVVARHALFDAAKLRSRTVLVEQLDFLASVERRRGADRTGCLASWSRLVVGLFAGMAPAARRNGGSSPSAVNPAPRQEEVSE